MVLRIIFSSSHWLRMYSFIFQKHEFQ